MANYRHMYPVGAQKFNFAPKFLQMGDFQPKIVFSEKNFRQPKI